MRRLSSGLAFRKSAWQFILVGTLLNEHRTHVESLCSQASDFREGRTGSWQGCLCGLAPSPAPLCLSLAWFQSGWEGIIIPVRVSAGLMEWRGCGEAEREAAIADFEACRLAPTS